MNQTRAIEKAFLFVKNKLFHQKTNLIYDHIAYGKETDFPTPTEILSGYPNPCGYTTGMEDGMINGATMLDACITMHEKHANEQARDLAKKLVLGMLSCAKSATDKGFLPRAVSIFDGKTHYTDSSRDQYTMFAFAMHRYLNSTLCTKKDKKEINGVIEPIARRLEKNVIKENGYDALTEDGRKTLATTMWGDGLDNHEYLRLPMIYLLAYETNGNEYWLEKYKTICDKAIQKSLPLINYWSLYALSQMMASIRLCYDVDKDQDYKTKYLSLMNAVCDYVESKVDSIRERINALTNYNAPQPSFRTLEKVLDARWVNLGYKNAVRLIRQDEKEFFTLQDGAQVGIILGLAPYTTPTQNAKNLFLESFAKIDLNVHERNLPVFFIDGYYRLGL